MLLHTLTPGQKLAFLRLVRAVATADKSLHAGERALIKELCQEMGISVLSADTEAEAVPVEKIFVSSESRAVVLIELARLSLADNTFSFGENESLKEIQRRFGFTKKDLNDALRLAEIYTLLRQGLSALAAACGKTPEPV